MGRSSPRGATPSPLPPRERLSVTSRRSCATLPWTLSRRCPLLPPPPPWRSATLTSGRTCTPTPSCPEAPPCTPVSLTACRRRSPPWPPPPSRSRSSHPPRGSTRSGSEAPSWPPCPPSSGCGSPSRSTTSAAPPSSTGSASKPNDDLQNLDENSKLETFYDAFPLDGGLTVKLLLPSPSFRASLDWPSLTFLFTLFHPKFPSPFPFQQLELF